MSDAGQLVLILTVTAAATVIFHVLCEVVVKLHRRSVVKNPRAWNLPAWDRFTRVAIVVADVVYGVVILALSLVQYRGTRLF
jgi:amino acid transporter